MKPTNKQTWIEKLERASNDGLIFAATGTYIKIRRWSPRRYYSCLSTKRVKAITKIITLRTERYNRRNILADKVCRQRSEALENAYASGVSKL